MPRQPDLTVKDFIEQMARKGFALSGGVHPRCRDLWHGAQLPSALTPVIVRRRLQRRATLEACVAAREAELARRAAFATETARRKAFAEMADDMAEISATRGSCDRDDLALRGWLFQQINDYGDRARAVAQQAQQMVAA